MTFVTDAGTLAGLFLRNGAGVEVSEVVIGAPQLDLSSTEVSQLTFKVSDPDLSLLASGAFAVGTNVDYYDLSFEIAAVATGGGTGSPVLDVTARARGIQAMKRKTGALVVANISPTAWARTEATSVGLGFIGQDSPKQSQITRTAPKAGETKTDSSWDVIKRLAGELAYEAFEAGGIIFFGKASWLISRPGGVSWTMRYPTTQTDDELAPVEVPVCRRTEDAQPGTPPVTIEVVLPYGKGVRMRPGDQVTLIGIPTFDGDYLVTSVPVAIDGVSDITVSLTTPTDRMPQKTASEQPFGDTAALTPLPEAPAPPSEEPDNLFDYFWPCDGIVGRKFEAGVHGGIDIPGQKGTLVHASRYGTVTYVGQAREDKKYSKSKNNAKEFKYQGKTYILAPPGTGVDDWDGGSVFEKVGGGYGPMTTISSLGLELDAARKLLGIVELVNDANHGLTVEIQHIDGDATFYQHLDQIVAKKDQKVKAGDLIGFMGSSGLTYGAPHSAPHGTETRDVVFAYLDLRTPDPSDTVVPAIEVPARLHFEIRQIGKGPVDPEPMLKARVSPPPAPRGRVLGPAVAYVI